MSKLIQKNKFFNKSLEISADGIIYESKGFLFKTKFKVPYEQLPKEPIIITIGVRRWLFIGATLLVLAIFSLIGTINQPTTENLYGVLFFSLLAAISFFIYWRSTNTYHGYICSEKEIMLFDNSPNEVEFSNFIEMLQDTRSKYLKDKYGEKDEQISHHVSSPIEELEKLFELKNKGIIDDTEYETMKKKIIGIDQKRIGFFQD
ncbi:SHOCT domain-containing protein [Paenibacillus sp. LHD-117]|uniref:SHOCT domain-containing protein n=1 Tax=Paenibacillus sp. LHD-117 TaxID=3071412 RepID=UPI0027E14B76|nr:SHOCT domain-containing protein [Paenibacillus sp. LHD-117]MDQ6418005.1 SHOCT domain-containing protein [Paenibacillus sp. LHD-117]